MIHKLISLCLFAIVLTCFSCDSKPVDINDAEAVRKELTGAWEAEKSFLPLFKIRERYEFTASGYKRWATPSYAKWETLPYDEGSYVLGDVRISELSGRKIRTIMMKDKESGQESYFMSFVEGDNLVSFEGKDDMVFRKVK